MKSMTFIDDAKVLHSAMALADSGRQWPTLAQIGRHTAILCYWNGC